MTSQHLDISEGQLKVSHLVHQKQHLKVLLVPAFLLSLEGEMALGGLFSQLITLDR